MPNPRSLATSTTVSHRLYRTASAVDAYLLINDGSTYFSFIILSDIPTLIPYQTSRKLIRVRNGRKANGQEPQDGGMRPRALSSLVRCNTDRTFNLSSALPPSISPFLP